MDYRSRDHSQSQSQRSLPSGLQVGYRSPSIDSGTNGSSVKALSRAEMFEDEKRRITSSCFSRTDEHGNLQTSYITHVRVVEDASSPSVPPPINSPPSNRKPRVIIVAVKATGRVHMYKARENDNGTFQIGKEWDLDQLKRLESFTHATPITVDDRQRAERAGTTGFIVTLAKPYYWQASTAKEKDFFLASLVKIFRKYTQGRVPELVGFSEKEEEVMLRVPPSGQPQQSANNTPTAVAWSPKKPSTSMSSINHDPRSTQTSLSSARYPSASANDSRLDGPAEGAPAWTPISARTSTPVTAHQRGMSSQDAPRTYSTDSHRPMHPHTPPVGGYPARPPPPPTDLYQARSHSPAPSHQSSAAASYRSRDVTHDPEIKAATASALSREPRSFDVAPLSPVGSDRWRSKANGTPTGDPYGPSYDSAAPIRSTPSQTNLQEPQTSPSQPPQPLPERRRPPLQNDEAPLQSTPVPAPLTGAQSLRERLGRRKESPLTPTEPLRQWNGVTKEEDASRSTSRSIVTAPEHANDARSTPDTEVQADSADLERTRTEDSLAAQSPAEPAAKSSESLPQTEEEQYRPGLGPMIKKKDTANRKEIASKFRKAATAYTAFQPRDGGALKKMLANRNKDPAEPDGVTGVVPAPVHREQSQDSVTTAQTDSSATTRVASPIEQEIPAVNVSSPGGQTQAASGLDEILQGQADIPKPLAPASQNAKEIGKVSATSENEAEKEPPVVPPRAIRTKKRRSDLYTNGMLALDIDPSIFGTRGLTFEGLLLDVGWDDTSTKVMKSDTLEMNLRREIAKSEAGAWMGSFNQRDERMDAVEKHLTDAIYECEQLDGLLTLYGVELGTLNEDVAYIEAQSHGLQVQTANQKLLQAQLQNLVQTISISPREMEPLRQSSLGDVEGLGAIEACLLDLSKALNMRGPGSSDRSEGDLSNMRALQDKKEMYIRETSQFLDRMLKYMDPTFGHAAMQIQDALRRPKGAASRSDTDAHDVGRNALWRFSPLMLFAKEADKDIWEGAIRLYQGRLRSVFHDEFREKIIHWKSRARKTSGEEQDALFTTQEKEPDGLTSTARKLTVKRSQTIARTFRQPSVDKSHSLKNQESRCHPFESFSGVADAMIPLIWTEQNFIVDFFHISSMENLDFADAVNAAHPANRKGPKLPSRRGPDPDRDMTRRVLDAMDDIFGFWGPEMQSLVEWATKTDIVQALGILCVLETKIAELEDTSQDFALRSMQQMRERASTTFTRFVDDQIRAIEDTKVKIKKRKGVIAFIRVFPVFSTMIETIIAPFDGPEKAMIRQRIDNAYEKINKAMFDSLKVIAKEVPSAMVGGTGGQAYGFSGGADPEDKEALNYHILLLENMYYYYTEVDERAVTTLSRWRSNAMREMQEHEELYVNAMIRRPLGKLLDYIESVEALMAVTPGNERPSEIPNTSPSHARPMFRKVLAAHDSREIRKGIDRLRERVDKHVGSGSSGGGGSGGADDASTASGVTGHGSGSSNDKLVGVVLKECERKYSLILERLQHIARVVYEDAHEIEFKREDIAAAFKLSRYGV